MIHFILAQYKKVSPFKVTPFYLLACLLVIACQQAAPVQEEKPSQPSKSETSDFVSPEVLYDELFVDVQMAQVFPDGKTFPDCTPKKPINDILKSYKEQRGQADFDLKAFIDKNFELPISYSSSFESDTNRSTEEHINTLWPILTRKADQKTPGTLIPLPKPYVVPGGRFGEIYYWDSYFTMLGLQVSNKVDLIENMVDNFAYLIDEIGFIPNGNRTYFLGRSQPPFFSLMVGLLAQEKGDSTLLKYLPQLEKEYNFWMTGSDQVNVEAPSKLRVVWLEDGVVLNRYWDNRTAPRAEMYRDDVETAEASKREEEEIYADIRAACESGWDFSSRWFQDGRNLTTIQTADIIPVDLNALLYNLELTLADAHALAGNREQSEAYIQLTLKRQEAIQKYCWQESAGFFMDYNFINKAHTPWPTLAGMYPLFFKLADKSQADATTAVIERDFLKPGGVVTTLNNTGQQWDAPNGWAPLQWITIQGLRNYNQNDLANTIRERWIALNNKVYQNTGKMVEKYNVEDMSLDAGGGEYPVQDGFGWSNGVYLKLFSEIK